MSVKILAKILDERSPGWANQIDIPSLNLFDPWGCILGQMRLSGEYSFLDVASRLRIFTFQNGEHVTLDVEIDRPQLYFVDPIFADEWKEEINARVNNKDTRKITNAQIDRREIVDDNDEISN